ncbi:hypothetical protein KCU93_g370, partial [Aureobasidium melanogenum]
MMSSQESISSPTGQAPISPPHTMERGKKRKLDEILQTFTPSDFATKDHTSSALDPSLEEYVNTEENAFQSQIPPRRVLPFKPKQYRGDEAVETQFTSDFGTVQILQLEIQYLAERLQYVLDRDGRHQHSPEYVRQFQLWTSHVRDGLALVGRAADHLLNLLEAGDRFDEDGLFHNDAEERPTKRQREQSQDQQLSSSFQDRVNVVDEEL